MKYDDLSRIDVGWALLTRLCQDTDKKLQLVRDGRKKPWSMRSVNVINTCVNPMYIEERNMITAFVQFRLPKPITVAKAKEIFSSTAPKYREVKGLIRKYYLLSEDGLTAGGAYLWRSRDEAEQFYTDDWRRFILEKYGEGAEPSLQYFSSPVIVDNLKGEIIKDD
jgi:hypothetical protein